MKSQKISELYISNDLINVQQYIMNLSCVIIVLPYLCFTILAGALPSYTHVVIMVFCTLFLVHGHIVYTVTIATSVTV